jgi:hypothetical protein
MPIGGFASNSVEKETILLNRALLRIDSIEPNYGDDPENPAPFDVKDDKGEVLWTSNPYVSALVTVVDDYATGDADGKQFYDKFFLSQHKGTGAWKVGEKGKLGRIFKTMDKYANVDFDAEGVEFDEVLLVKHTFEAETQQKEDRNGTKLKGTRINYETISAVPKRGKKKKATKNTDKPTEEGLTPEQEAEMIEALG